MKTIAANGARAAAPNVAAIATSANADGEMPMPGNARTSSSPVNAPNVLLMMRMGASVPPEVPDPSAIHQMTSLPMHSAASVPSASRPASVSSMTS